MQNILNSGFAGVAAEILASNTAGIITQLTGNAYFPTTDPTLAQVQAALDLLNQALAMPEGTARTTAVHAARRALEKLLGLLAENLEKTANGDLVKLATTGFELRKASTQTGVAPAVPENLRLRQTGASGEVQVVLDASPRAKSYQVQIALDPNAGPWLDYDIFSSSRGIILHGQTHAKDIWVRVRAIGPNQTKSGWSDPATILVN